MLEEYTDGVNMRMLNVGKEAYFNIILQTLKKERCGKKQEIRITSFWGQLQEFLVCEIYKLRSGASVLVF